MDAIAQCIAELEARRGRIEDALRMLKSLGGEPGLNGRPQPMPEAEPASATARPKRDPKRRQRATGLRAAVRAAVEQCGTAVHIDQVAEKVEGHWTRKQVSDALCQMGIAGELRKVGRGSFERVESPTESSSPPVTTRPEGRSATERMQNALLGAVAGATQPLSAAEVVKIVRSQWPGLWDSNEQETNLRVRLMDLAGAGRIHREGRGPDAKYSERA